MRYVESELSYSILSNSDTFGQLCDRTPKITLQAIALPKITLQAIALPKISQTLIYHIHHGIQAGLRYKTYV
ncbi:hypothetical protein [Trichormus variabilis]|uniref:hypothetical protein n=1 Tax=Anabaena variabilis TaxID=264691 RepID=UPI00131581F9|nr:hypothetical protein [Trichormus variabilis]MBD2627858.1 hypothetical protein [Trichormus variabilis FACHB-164]